MSRRFFQFIFLPGWLKVALLVTIALLASRTRGEDAGPELTLGAYTPDESSTNEGVIEVASAAVTNAGNVLRFLHADSSNSDLAATDLCAAAAADIATAEPVETVSPAVVQEIAGLGVESCDTADGCVNAPGSNELWIISTRNLPPLRCGSEPHAFTPCVRRYICGQGWQKSSLDDFLAGDDGAHVTMVFVHGNDTEYDEAIDMGRTLYNRLVNTRCEVPPTRLVIWSWPSEKDLVRVRKAAQEAACRTNSEGFYFAEFVDLLPDDSVYSLCGYSYGARIVTGGLQVLGGGAVAGHSLSVRQHPDHQPANVMLLGAALDNNSLLPGMRHGLALSQVERMVILFNPADRVLFWYQHLWQRRGPQALGSTGQVAASRLGADRAKLTQINVEAQLGGRHSWQYVSGSPTVMSIVRRELLSVPAAEIRRDKSVAPTVSPSPSTEEGRGESGRDF